MRKKRMKIILACMGLGPVFAWAALSLAGRFGTQPLFDTIFAFLFLPWRWLPELGEGMTWLLVIGGSGLLYGLLAGLVIVRLQKI